MNDIHGGTHIPTMMAVMRSSPHEREAGSCRGREQPIAICDGDDGDASGGVMATDWWCIGWRAMASVWSDKQTILACMRL